jgi:hypothetical protein
VTLPRLTCHITLPHHDANLLSDGIHPDIAHDGNERTPTVGFDYGEVDRNLFGNEEPRRPSSVLEMSAALCLILEWICASPDLKHCAGRAAALMCMIDPVNSPHNRRDLTAIARECGVTKQAVSKWLADLGDQTGVSLTVGKRSSMREKYRAAQIAALEKGTHSSFVRKAKAA